MKKSILFATVLAACMACLPDVDPLSYDAIAVLTDGSSKRWKVASASLTNAGQVSDVSHLANVRDDEFTFSMNNATVTMNWSKRNEIRAHASNASEVLLDYYLSNIVRDIAITSDGVIAADNTDYKLELVSDTELLITAMYGSTEVRFTLTAESEPYEIPTTLEFAKISEVSGAGLEQAAGFTGSMASNSLYIAYRLLEGTLPERVVRYDITNNTSSFKDYAHSDFVTKELHIINDQLKVVGARYVNTYSLDLQSEPVSAPHNLTLTRYGSTVVDNNVFIFGGDLNGITNPEASKANEIYQHDQETGNLTLIGELPEPRYWAHGQIVSDKLYVFGGRQSFISEEAEDDVFVVDMITSETETLKLPKSFHRTFASRFEHLIIVGGQYETNTNGTFGIETTIGFFDTHDNTFTIVPSSFQFSGTETIYGLTVVGSKLYILTGTPDGTTFAIREAEL